MRIILRFLLRLLYGIVAGIAWAYLARAIMIHGGLEISNDIQMLSTAIIIAGAMAGGD